MYSVSCVVYVYRVCNGIARVYRYSIFKGIHIVLKGIDIYIYIYSKGIYCWWVGGKDCFHHETSL